MRTARGDIWLARADALVITTNAMRRRDGAAVMGAGLRRYVKHTGAPLPEAFKAASVRPGALIGLELGVRPGALADLIVLDDELAVRRVMRRGSWLGS